MRARYVDSNNTEHVVEIAKAVHVEGGTLVLFTVDNGKWKSYTYMHFARIPDVIVVESDCSRRLGQLMREGFISLSKSEYKAYDTVQEFANAFYKEK